MDETGLATPHGTLWLRTWPGPDPCVVALHGFSLHGGMFGTVADLLGADHGVAAPDLPGHGRTTVAAELDPTLTALATWLSAIGRPVPLLGYSQGGRIALHLAAARPDLVSHLVLVSTSPGLTDAQRSARRRADDDLARRIERQGLGPFLDDWLADPVVGTGRLHPSAAAADRKLREQNSPEGLAAALRGLGQGALPPVDPAGLAMPALWIAGALDPRYATLARDASATSRGQVTVIPGAGHNVVAERPAELASLVAGFVSG